MQISDHPVKNLNPPMLILPELVMKVQVLLFDIAMLWCLINWMLIISAG
jgi:hypothetical protein